jgi:hypothetical protein
LWASFFSTLPDFHPSSTPLSAHHSTVSSVVVLYFHCGRIHRHARSFQNMNPRPNMPFFSLVALLPVVLLWVVVQADPTTFPATVEVDLIFPRNDTYAPSALFPIVFAFQNAALAPSSTYRLA